MRTEDINNTARNFADLPQQSRPWLLGAQIDFYINDSDELLDGALDVVEDTQALIRALNEAPLTLNERSDKLNRDLAALDGRTANASMKGGVGTWLDLSNTRLWFSLNAYGRVAGRFEYSEEDENRIALAITPVGGATGLELESRMLIAGLFVADVGVTWLGEPDWRSWFGDGWFGNALQGTQLAIRPKATELIFYERNVPIQQYAEDQIYDRERDVATKTTANIDIAAFKQFSNLGLGLRLENLVPQSFDSKQTSTYHQRPHLVLNLDTRLGPALGRPKLSAELELTPRDGFGEVDDRQLVDLSSRWQVHKQLELGFGTRLVFKDKDEHALAASVRYRLGNAFYLNVDARAAGSREFGGGAAIQLEFD